MTSLEEINVSGEQTASVDQKTEGEILREKEECFCAVLDTLLARMEKADKASKEAAKSLLIVMESEIDSSVSLLVYNAYVREYNALREQYFLSMAADLRSKTIKLSREIMDNIEEKTKTIRIQLAPVLNRPADTRI